MQYRADIDGLRAVAIICVVIFHAFPRLLPGGFVGVDVFFVISGYLISGVIITALKNGAFTFAVFYKRRILRIFPALTVTLAACFIAGWFLLWPNEFKALGKHIAGGASFISNILLYGETGYFDEAAQSKFLLNLWSLGIEEQFYIVFPLLLWLLFRWPRAITPALAILLLLSFTDNIFLAGVHPDADFYLPLSRFWELLTGAVLQCGREAALRPPYCQRVFDAIGASRKLVHILTCVGLIFLAGALIICKNDEGHYPGWAALLPVCASTALIAAGPNGLFNKYVLANPISVYLGKISYTLYLWHWPLLAFAYVLMGRPAYENAPAIRAALLAAAFILAALTFRFIERPIRFGGLFGKYKISILVTAMCAMFACGLGIWRANGFIGRLPANERERYSQLLAPAMLDDACLAYTGAKKDDFAFCRHEDSAQPVTVALVGDSHAHAAFSGLARLGQKMGFNTLLLGRFPERPEAREEIRRQTNDIVKLLREKKDIKQIVVVVRGMNYLMRKHNPGDRRNDRLPLRDYDSLLAEMRDITQRLAATGKPVLVVEDTPDLNADIRDTIPRWTPFGYTSPIYPATPKWEARQRQEPYQKIMNELGRIPGVRLARGSLDAFCPGQDCLLFNEKGLPLYYDDDHLSPAGSDYLARKVIEPALKHQWLETGTHAKD